MKLSARARYAVRLMLEVHRLGTKGKPVTLSEIARRTGISRRFLEQLAIGLRNRSLLRAVPGRNGGYFLARRPSEVSIRQVITSVIGPISLAICVEDPYICMHADYCECRLLWSLLQSEIDKLLDRYSIADLANPQTMDLIRAQIEATERISSIREDRLDAGTSAASGAPACARLLSQGICPEG